MLKILNPGIYSSIQDEGRFGYRKFGVPVSGAMDQEAYRLANNIVGNPEDEAVIEFAHVGPKIEFNSDFTIALAGGEFRATLNGIEIINNHPTNVKIGDILEIKNALDGAYGYLGIAGEWNVEQVYNSKSQYQNITSSPRLLKGDLIEITSADIIQAGGFSERDFKSVIEVMKGPEFDDMIGNSNDLFTAKLRVGAQSNRMGFKLESDFKLMAKEIITSPVMPGVVQLTPGGELIALMRDAQTTGGYSRVLIIEEHSLNHLVQIKPGSYFTFKLVV